MALTGRFVALATLGLVLVLLPPIALAMWAAALVVAAVADLALAARIRDLRLSRDASQPVRLDETGSTTVRLTNTGRRALRARVRDAWGAVGRTAPTRGSSCALAQGSAGSSPGTLRPTRRGERSSARR